MFLGMKAMMDLLIFMLMEEHLRTNFYGQMEILQKILDNLNAGIYSVTIVDQNDCQVNYEFEVTEPEFLFVNLSSNSTNCGNYQISCNGDETANINVGGGGTPFFDTEGNHITNMNGATFAKWRITKWNYICWKY